MNWLNLLLSRPILVVATLALTIAEFIGPADRPWNWIIGICIFILIHEIVNWRREQNISNRLKRNYESIQRRVLRLIADLSELTANEYDLWMIDLYVPRSSKLVRELSIALTDVRIPFHEIPLNHGLFGRCFKESCQGLWWNIELIPQPISTPQLEDHNFWDRLDYFNIELEKTYGVISVHPIVDALGKNCLGLLVVHTKRDSETATKALGSLTQSMGKRRLAEACHDIHDQMKK